MFHHFIQFFYFHFKSLGLFGAFLSMLIENIGIPLPTEIGYLIARELIVLHTFSYFFVLVVLTFGHVLGSTISYGIGLWGDGIISNKLKNGHKIKEIDLKLKKWYANYGSATVFLTRFVGYVRPWSSFVAGLARVKFWQFLFWTTLGSLIFNIGVLYFSGVLIKIWQRYAGLHMLIAITIFLCFFGFIIYNFLKMVFGRNKSTISTNKNLDKN